MENRRRLDSKSLIASTEIRKTVLVLYAMILSFFVEYFKVSNRKRLNVPYHMLMMMSFLKLLVQLQ